MADYGVPPNPPYVIPGLVQVPGRIWAALASAAMCCFKQSGHQQLAPGADGTGTDAGKYVHQHGCAAVPASASAIAHENWAPQREQILIWPQVGWSCGPAYRMISENTTR